MEKEKSVVSRSRKRPFRLTWINPRTGLMCSLRYASYAGAIDRLHSMIKRENIVCAEIWECITGGFHFRRYSYVDFRSMHENGEVAF